MPAILTVTFSPCIDKSAVTGKLIPEKKLRCHSVKLEPGGGGINVARAIHQLGGEATAIFPSGGYTGRHFNKLLEQEGVPAVIIETENETRENIIVLEEATNQQFRFGMPGTALKEREWRQLLQAVEDAAGVQFIVASGSLPPGVPMDIFARIGAIAKKKKAKFIADTSGEALRQAVKEGLYLLKPNLGELSSLLGRDYLHPGEIAPAARQVIAAGDCEVVVVSMGKEGAMLVTKDIVQQMAAPPAEKKSTVGAGDSMVAGIVLGLSQNKSLPEAVQYGIACGTAATMNAGTELCRPEQVNELLRIMQAG